MNKKQHTSYPRIFALFCSVALLAFAACDEIKEKLESRPVIITQTIPGTTTVRDQVTAADTRGSQYDIQQIDESRYQAIIVSDTIMTLTEEGEEEGPIIIADTIILNFLEIDPDILGALQTDLALTANEYIEKQMVGSTFRMERGPVANLDPGLLQNKPSRVFDPADAYRVVSTTRNSICVQRRDDMKNSECFNNVERRVLVVQRNNRIEVYELAPNLAS